MATDTMHLGRKISRIRELKGMKQETLAHLLGVSQQAVSKLEQSEHVDEDRLTEVGKVLGLSTEAIKNFNEDAIINVIGNTVTNHDNASVFNYFPTYNPFEKIVELYEALLKSEREKIELMEKVMKEKK